MVTANVLTFQLAVEKAATGFLASGRRLEFEKRIAELEVDFAGIQEGRQRASTTRQVGSHLFCCVSCGRNAANGVPEAWIHRKHVSKPKHIIIMLSDARR